MSFLVFCLLFCNVLHSQMESFCFRVNPVHHISQDLLLSNRCDHLNSRLLDNVHTVEYSLRQRSDSVLRQRQRNWRDFINAEKIGVPSLSTVSHTAHNVTLLDAMGSMLLETFAKVFSPWGKKYFRIYFAMTATKHDMRYYSSKY